MYNSAKKYKAFDELEDFFGVIGNAMDDVSKYLGLVKLHGGWVREPGDDDEWYNNADVERRYSRWRDGCYEIGKPFDNEKFRKNLEEELNQAKRQDENSPAWKKYREDLTNQLEKLKEANKNEV